MKQQELIRSIVEEYFEVDITTNSRKRKFIEARAMYYKLMREHTGYSLYKIGESVGKDHAVAINGLNRLDGWLTYDRDMSEIYNELTDMVLIALRKEEGFIRFDDTEQLYEVKYNEILKDYNELAKKYLYIRKRLERYEPTTANSDTFALKEEIDANKEEA